RQTRRPGPPKGRAARQATPRQSPRVRPMSLSEARLSHLAQILMKTVTGNKLGTDRSDHHFLADANNALTEDLSIDRDLDRRERVYFPEDGSYKPTSDAARRRGRSREGIAQRDVPGGSPRVDDQRRDRALQHPRVGPGLLHGERRRPRRGDPARPGPAADRR